MMAKKSFGRSPKKQENGRSRIPRRSCTKSKQRPAKHYFQDLSIGILESYYDVQSGDQRHQFDLNILL